MIWQISRTDHFLVSSSWMCLSRSRNTSLMRQSHLHHTVVMWQSTMLLWWHKTVTVTSLITVTVMTQVTLRWHSWHLIHCFLSVIVAHIMPDSCVCRMLTRVITRYSSLSTADSLYSHASLRCHPTIFLAVFPQVVHVQPPHHHRLQ